MISTAPISSTIATVVRNSLSEVGARRPSSAMTPIAKAMSVADGNRPAAREAGGGARYAKEDERRDRHSAPRRDHRQSAIGPACKMAVDEFTFDLEPDEQEEQRHQAVVDPVVDALSGPNFVSSTSK
jgi:hypothetical protein